MLNRMEDGLSVQKKIIPTAERLMIIILEHMQHWKHKQVVNNMNI